MSTDILMKGFFAAVFSLIFAWVVFSRYDNEIGSENNEDQRQCYLPYVSGALLPMFILCLTAAGLIFYKMIPTAQMALSMCFSIFLHISLYYAVLLLVLPFLRKYISARACAMLWLIPNYLYITEQNYMQVPEPLIVIHASGNWVWILFGVWLVGFVSVLLWKIVSHLIFRRRMLANASAVSDRDVLEIWHQEIKSAKIKKAKFQLMVSRKVSSPLTIGLFRRSMKVVLPVRTYSADELRLIFRHEIIHIGREDSWSKFFMMFCTAMCWFNPLMWVAMRKSADDMELSCDETVLLGSDTETRQQYAHLLLSAAGDERGFTTCLSAAASSMRYRLKSVVKPRKLRSGAIIVGLTFFILCMTCGYVALAYGDSTGEDVLFQQEDLSLFKIRSISLKDDPFHTHYVCVDETAFNKYLAGLEMDHLTGNYSFSQSDRQFTYIFDAPEGTMVIVLSDHRITLVPLYGKRESVTYYLPDGIDWDYLNTIILAYPAMNIHLEGKDDPYGMDISAALNQLTIIADGNEKLLYQSTIPEDNYAGVWGDTTYEKAAFSFSYTLMEPFIVEIENWDHTALYTLTQDELDDPFVIPLPESAAHYKIYAAFFGHNETIYKAEFGFELGDINRQ